MAPPESKRRKTDTHPGPTISDPRFANIQSDPRYRLPGKNQKIKLDKRFARVVRDEEFSRKAKVDRYGRSIQTDLEKKRLKRKYEFEEDQSDVSDEADDDNEVQKELQRVEESRDLLREGKNVSSSEDESSSEEESDLVEDVEEQIGPGQRRSDVPMGEVSSRLAVVNLDWDNIRAEDLIAVFSSFLPPTGRLLKVTIYPSEFGKERMEREETEGPPKEIFANEEEADESEEDEEDIKNSLIKPDDGSEFDSKALRQYQLDRLRYFYAVLTFSNPEAAKSIYDKVDGTEYLSTANFFDLRFIADETDFTDDKPREECEQIPAGYKPNEFVTDALQHSKVKLTWDAEDKGRKEAQARAFRGSRQDIDENDLKAYLGSDSDSDSEGDDVGQENDQMPEKLSKKETERQRMRARLGLSAEPVKKAKKEKDTPTGDIQITFSAGLSGAVGTNDSSDEATTKKKSKRSVFANSPEPEETTMEKYVRKEKERKQRRKEKTKNPSAVAAADETTTTDAQVEDATNDDLGFEDPFFVEADAKEAKSSGKIRKEERLKKRHEREAEEAANAKSRAELELLMADDDNANNNSTSADIAKGHTVRHFDMNEIEKAEKAARKKGKKYKNKLKLDVDEILAKDDFSLDTTDPRFASVFENHEFAIDPSNPRFKQTNAMKSLLDEGRKRKGQGRSEEPNAEKMNGKTKEGREKGTKDSITGDGDEVMGLVEKIKRRNKA